MRCSGKFLAILALALLLAMGSTLRADDVVQQRLLRWQQQSLGRPTTADISYNAQLPSLGKSFSPAVADIKINNDNSSATFSQRFSDVAYFPDGKGAVVWEDERNGEWEIYAQTLSADGLPSGSNLWLIHDAGYRSQRQPRIAVNASGKMALVWSEEESGSIYSMIYNSSLTAQTSRIKLNDNNGSTIVNLPAITALSNGRFAVVWEDSRNGANIYGQIIDDAANKIGSNFPVNSAVTSPYRIAPAVCAGPDTTFAVVWEDARSGSGHAYFRILKNDGSALYSDLLLEATFPTAYQFNPALAYIKGQGYLAGWISTRDNGQSAYAQLISPASALIDTSYRLNTNFADVCWDLRFAAGPDSGAGCVFADYQAAATILFQKVSKLGKLSGANVELNDNSLLGERSFPVIAFRPLGVSVCWSDQRNGNSDIYQQRLDLAYAKVSANLILDDDLAGSQQDVPDIAWLPQGSNAIVWHDCKNDPGDIYLQRVTIAGALSGAAIRVNDDPGKSLQDNPRIGSATGGNMVVTWEDSRTATGVGGQNIFAQRLSSAGSTLGANFLVNDDGTLSPKSQPDIAVGNSGAFVIVWTDQRADRKRIYLQRSNSSGAAQGTNVFVADAPGAAESFAPHVGMRGDGSFVVSFLSIIGGRQTLYFQRYNNSGQAVGDLQMLAVDTSAVQVTDADIFVHDFKGDFYIAATLTSGSDDVVKWYRYDFDGNLGVGDIQVSDVTGAGFQSLRTTGDIDDGIIVSWSDLRSGVRRSYFQILREDGLHLGINTPISTIAIPALEQQPATVLNNGYVFGAWADNRNAGRGFDIFLNFDQYTSTDVGDIHTTLPRQFELEQNFPNPFNPETVIRYSLRTAQPVKLIIYNTLGQQVRVLTDEYQSAGAHFVTWDGTAASGQMAASGVYFYRLQVADHAETRKMTLLK